MGSGSARDAWAPDTDVLHVIFCTRDDQQGKGKGQRAQQHGPAPAAPPVEKKGHLCPLSRLRHTAEPEGQERYRQELWKDPNYPGKPLASSGAQHGLMPHRSGLRCCGTWAGEDAWRQEI